MYLVSDCPEETVLSISSLSRDRTRQPIASTRCSQLLTTQRNEQSNSTTQHRTAEGDSSL